MHPAGKPFFLVHAYGAVHLVVKHHDGDGQLQLHRRGQFVRTHHEATVPRQAQYRALRVRQLGANGSGQAIAHSPAGGRNLAAIAAVTVVAVCPGGVIARAVTDDHIVRQSFVKRQPGLRHVDGAGLAGCWLTRPAKGFIARAQGLQMRRKAGR